MKNNRLLITALLFIILGYFIIATPVYVNRHTADTAQWLSNK
jgi:hypothetical protein